MDNVTSNNLDRYSDDVNMQRLHVLITKLKYHNTMNV